MTSISRLSDEMVDRLVYFDGMKRNDAENFVADIRLIFNEKCSPEDKTEKLENLREKYGLQ